jgi:hypothetical protein
VYTHFAGEPAWVRGRRGSREEKERKMQEGKLVQHKEEQQQRGGGSFVFGKSDDTRARGRERERGRKQRVVAIEMTHSLPMNTVCVWASDSLREREILNSRYYSPLPTHCHRFFCGIDVIAFLCCRLWTKKKSTIHARRTV